MKAKGKNKFLRIYEALFYPIISSSYPEKIEDRIKHFREKIKYFFNGLEYRFNTRFNRDKFTCPYRMNQVGPWGYKENLDYWRKHGKDRCCSFCSSWHPNEFTAFLDEVISTKAEKCHIEISDKKYKIYITRLGILNAGEGTIKFKTHHLSKEQYQNNYLKINEAHKLSRDKFMAEMDIKYNLRGDKKNE